MKNDYIGAQIVNVRRGKPSHGRASYVYAELRSASGELLINASFDYIIRALREHLTWHEMQPFEAQIKALCEAHQLPDKSVHN